MIKNCQKIFRTFDIFAKSGFEIFYEAPEHEFKKVAKTSHGFDNDF